MSPLKKIFHKSKSLINRSSESYGYIAFGMAIILFATKVSALFKQQLMTSVFGIGRELDIFNAANTIPEFIFTIIVIGGINASLIPILTQTSSNEDEKRLKQVFSSIVNLFFLILLVVSTLVFIFAPQIISPVMKLQIGGAQASLSPEDIAMFAKMLRILILSPIILCVSSIFSSILQIKKRFFITTLSTLFYNFGIIIATFAAKRLNAGIEFLGYGVILGSILHFAVQLPAIISSKVPYSPLTLVINDFYIIKAIKQTLPRIVGLASDYIGNIFQTLIAFNLFYTGSLTAFKLANSLREIPITMFGIAISASVFPRMSELADKGDKKEFQKLFSTSLRTILFWTLPISVLFIVLRTPIVRLLFGVTDRGLDFEQTRLISYSLLFLSLSIVFYSILNLVNRAFYSLDDSKTPTLVSIFVIFFELALTYALANLFSHFDDSLSVNPLTVIENTHNYFSQGQGPAAIGGIALASSIAIFVNLGLLIYFLKKKGVFVFYQPQFIVKKIVSSLFMFVVGLISFKFFDSFFNTNKVVGLFFFTINMAFIMGLTFYVSEKTLGDEDINILDDPIARIKRSFTGFKQTIKKTDEVTGVNA